MVAERRDRYPKGTYKVLFVGQQGGAFEYRLINLATGMRVSATSIWDLLKSIENDLSANRFPQSAIQYRTWGSGASPARREPLSTFSSPRSESCPQESPAGPTFIVRVLYRQNATWQGTIQWMEGRQTRQYRSVNELLNLMDDAAESRPESLEVSRDA